jgi:hypothetical protein
VCRVCCDPRFMFADDGGQTGAAARGAATGAGEGVEGDKKDHGLLEDRDSWCP